jgi:hypothetical protein
MNSVSRWLATVGALVAGPAFLLNFVAHGGVMPGPEEVDRVDGAFSLMFMGGVALIVLALIVAEPSPLGRKGRWLLYVEAAMVVFAAMWAAFIIADPGNSESNHPLLLVGDACWPLHQLLMLVIGIVAVRADRWPSPAKFALFGPAAGVVILLIGAAVDADFLSATAIGAGWVIAAIGMIAVMSCDALTSGGQRIGWRLEGEPDQVRAGATLR